MPLLSCLRPRRRLVRAADLAAAAAVDGGAEDRSADPTHRELAVRVTDGLRVVLSWRPPHDDVVVSVDDSRTGERFEIAVARDRAMHAFHHPFAYAA